MNNRFIQALTHPSFFFLFLAEALSQIAMNMMNFMLILVAYSMTNSNTAVSGIVLSFTIPAILFGIIAGVYVDRWNKKTVLLFTNLLRALLLVTLAFLHTNLILLYSITFVISIVTQFFIPAETPMIPVLVEKQLLLAANALFGIALFGSVLIAYALSGPFLAWLGPRNAFFALAILYTLGAFAVTLIRVPKSAKKVLSPLKLTVFRELKDTVQLIRSIKNLYHAFFLLALSQILILIIAVIGPGYARQILGITIDEFPLKFVTPAVIGMGIGTFVISNYLHKMKKQKSATIGLFVSALAIFLLPFGSQVTSRPFVHVLNHFLPHILQINILHIMVILAAAMGFANALIFVPSNTIIQEETTDEMRGKIYGALNAIVAVLSLLPVIVVGSLADIFGVATVLTILAIFIALIGVFRVFFL